MGKLELVVLVGFLLACFALFTAPVVVAQENDNTPPSAPASVTGSSAAGSSVSTSEVITTTSITITGTTEAESTVKVYKTTNNGVTWTVDTSTAATATAASDGTWAVTVSVTEGVITGIKVTSTDTAGNESTATVLGYVLADSSSPTVTITSPTTGMTTTATSIVVSGTVTKDAWESYSDLTLTIQVGTSAVTVPIASDGSFSTSVALSLGTNTIVATVTDGVNLPSVASVIVTRATSYATITPTPVAVTIENIAAQVGQVISVGENGITSVTVQSAQAVVINFEAAQPVNAISVSASATVETISVETQELTQTPVTVPEPTTAVPGVIVSHYLEITVSPTAATSVQIKSAAIEFKVQKSWLETNKIISDSVTLLKYENGQWVELPTAATGRDDATYKYYTATTSGFSTFAVVGKAASFDLMLILGISASIVVVIVIAYVGFRRRGGETTELKPAKAPP